MSDLVVAFDPGKDGFISYLHDGETGSWPMPTVKIGKGGKRDYDITALRTILDEIADTNHDIDLAVIEKQQAMPGQGVTSMFSIGMGYGLLLGLVTGLRLPYAVVHPRTWKKIMLRDVPGDDQKGRSIIAAGRLFPNVDLRKSERARKPHDGKAESLLLAWYGLHHLLLVPEKKPKRQRRTIPGGGFGYW